MQFNEKYRIPIEPRIEETVLQHEKESSRVYHPYLLSLLECLAFRALTGSMNYPCGKCRQSVFADVLSIRV